MRKSSMWEKALLAIVFWGLLSASAAASSKEEKFIFDLSWTGIKAGTATLEITAGSDFTRITSTAQSADWVSLFYTVDDRVQSVLLSGGSYPGIGLPQNYRMKIREGKHRRDKEVFFDLADHKAVFIDHIKGEKKEFPISKNVLDPLSSFFFVRTLPFEVGKSVFVDMFDSNKLWNVEVKVLRKEKIETKLGRFDTIVIKPLMQSEGIFYRKGDMYIWLTDDEKRIPVKLQTKVAVGSVTATLVGGSY